MYKINYYFNEKKSLEKILIGMFDEYRKEIIDE